MLTYVEISEYFNVVLGCFACFFAILMIILFYHGVFSKVVVKATKPPFSNDLFVAYKFTLSYKESQKLLAEAQSIAPHLDSFSIYHEAFYQTRNQVGSSVGVVLPEGMGAGLYKRILKAGYKVAIFPAVDFAVISSFPYKNYFSLAVAVNRIYPRFKDYIKVNRLCAHPIMELYTKETVYFIAPLSKQFDFYADEAIQDYSEEEESASEKDSSEELMNCSTVNCRPKRQCKKML